MTKQHTGTEYGGPPPENYERFFVPAIGAPLAEDLVSKAAPRPGERVLDVACGTGIVARLAARQVGPTGTVTGLDLNAGMLAVARANAPPGTPIDWQEANAERMPLPDASFDVVLSQMGLQFVPDKSAALREMQRVLDTDGRLLLNVPGPTPPLFQTMAEVLGRHVGAETAGFVQQVFCLHDESELRDLVHAAGFHEIDVTAEVKALQLPKAADFLWQYVHSTPLAAAVAQVDDGTRARIEPEIVDLWQPYTSTQGLDLEVRSVTLSATK